MTRAERPKPLDRQIAEKRKDKAFLRRVRAILKRDRAVLDALRDR